MAITKEARRKIFSLVQNSKDLLVKEVESQLEQYFGIHTNGSVIDVDLLTSKDADKIYTARILRQRLKYIQANQLSGDKSIKDAIRLLISEEAFTILNRFASLRMAEERNIIRESVRKAYNSEGFLVFDSITGQGQVTDIYTRYTWYLNAVFDELSIDLPALFDRFSPFALVFPSEQALIRLLDVLNNEEITIYREEGLQPVNLWKEDETIGWIYQYYNSKEEIKEMREASDLPRNSRELAVRNQFFTPRYVVQFLTDNSLGRIWYEMTQGQTKLVQLCTYLIHRNGEIFLQKGQTNPEQADSKIQYIDYRAIKDPREIKMLDPACGSMHFGLYSFDIFEQIYTEAWDKYPNLFSDLRDKYTRAEFIAQVPVLIIRHNIHGVDIDPRALQIAGLSLWLRAQKSFDKLGLQAKDRPTITRANLVLAEPMPGNEMLLNSLLKTLDLPMQQLVRAIWDKMLLAGETGLLLKIEQEITAEIAKIAKEWAAFAKQVQAKLGDTQEQISKAKQAVKYSHPDYWQNFFDTAEQQVLDILKQLAEEATNGEAYQTLLFAEDAQRGFAFIELCQQKYDVVLMNPPFGIASKNTIEYLRTHYNNFCDNLYIGFTIRMFELIKIGGMIGSITDRSFINKQSFEGFRQEVVQHQNLIGLVDLGADVLDGANVEVSAQIFSACLEEKSFFIDLKSQGNKEYELSEILKTKNQISYLEINSFNLFPHTSFVYNLPSPLLNSFRNGQNLSTDYFMSQRGLASSNALQMFRLFWEINPAKIDKSKEWTYLQNGSPYCPYYFPTFLLVISNSGSFKTVLSYDSGRITGIENYYTLGLSYGKRTENMYGYKMREDQVFTVEGHGVFPMKGFSIWHTLLIINSSPYLEIINHLCGQHKTSGYVNPARIEISKFIDKSDELKLLVNNLEFLDTGNEISPVFNYPHFFNFREESLFQKLQKVIDYKYKIEDEANTFRNNYNILVENKFGWNGASKYRKEVKYNELFYNFKSNIKNESLSLISYFIGCLFGRWDIRLIFCKSNNFFENEFSALNALQPGRLKSSNNNVADELSIIENNWHRLREHLLYEVHGLKNIDKHQYEVEVFWDGIAQLEKSQLRNSLLNNLEQTLRNYLGESDYNILLQTLDTNDLSDVLLNQNVFFDFHYSQYTNFRREAPIYWPISSVSGNYTIWLYYPKLNDQTLYRIVNSYLKPKISEIETEISQLENNANLDNKGLRQLNELINLKLELQDFEKEILRIAQLPYIPNHDDGVLITAAPLHSLFRHSKWRKSTEDCWKALEKGEYDWAHLAYSIWPARVKTKCKKNLSMAIAHGLEDICDIKSKEKQAKNVTEPKEKKNKQSKLDL